MTALLTDEEIRSTAATERDCYKHRGFDFEAGARFARSIYEADRAKLLDRIAELEVMVKFRDDFIRERYVQAFADCFPPIPLPKGGE